LLTGGVSFSEFFEQAHLFIYGLIVQMLKETMGYSKEKEKILRI
jgi:hypothetical protein